MIEVDKKGVQMFINSVNDAVFSCQACVNVYVLKLSRTYFIPVDVLFIDQRNRAWELKKKYFEKQIKSKVKQRQLIVAFNEIIDKVILRREKQHFQFSLFNQHFLIRVEKIEDKEHLIILGSFCTSETIQSHIVLRKCIRKLRKFYSKKVNKYLYLVIDEILATENFYRHSLGFWAKKIGYDYSYLSREFKKYVGCSYSYYREKYRIEHAKNDLLMTQLSIEEISNFLGFYDSSHFFNSFFKEERNSPTFFRNRYKKLNK